MSALGRRRALRLVGSNVTYLDSTRNRCDTCGYVWNHTVLGAACPSCAADGQDGGGAA